MATYKKEFILSGGIGLSADRLFIVSATNSTTISTGSLILSGGAGIAQSLSIGGSLQIFNGSNFTAFKASSASNNIYTLPNQYPAIGTSVLQSNTSGEMTWAPMIASSSSGNTTQNIAINTAGSANVFHPVLLTPLALSAGSAVSADTTITFNPSTEILYVSGLAITAQTASTNSSSGALIVTGGVGIGGSLFVAGDLTINGTTTTINTVTVTVDDKNIELGSVATPSDVTAEGGGITLRGATDKSINWYTGTGWSSSESWNLASGNTYKINNTTVLSSNTLGTGIIFSSIQTAGIITSGTWSATAITALYGGTGLVPSFAVGDILYANTASTWGRLTANSNAGYVLISAGSGATPTYVAQSTLSVGLATTATYAHQSGYAITSESSNTSGFATTASYAHQSGYAITSGSSSFANTATYAHQSGYAVTSGTATTAISLNVVAASTNANHYILFTPASGSASGIAVSSDAGLLFNPASNTLTTNTFSAGVSVNTVAAGVSGSTASISPLSGALTVTGGVGIGGSVSVGGRLQIFNGANYTAFVSSASGNTVYTLPATSPAIGSSVLQSDSAGVMSWVPMTATSSSSSSGGTVASAIQYQIAGYYAGSGASVAGSPTFTNNTATGQVQILHTTASTGTSIGALQVAGGVGISGRLSFNQASFGTTGITTIPTMAMIGQTGDPIYMSVLEDNSISFEGSQGQLFSITPNLSTGYIYAVNDITGIPLLRANANANVTANEYAGNFGIGLTNPGYKLHVLGSVGFTSTTASTSATTGTLVVSGGVGIGQSLSVGGYLQIFNGANYTSFVSSASGNTVYILPATSPAIGASVLQSTSGGVMSWVPMTATSASGNTSQNIFINNAGNANIFHPVLFTPLQSSSGSAISSDSTISFNPSTEILYVSGLAVTSVTASTSSTLGALVVSGGVGIGGSLYVSSATAISGVTINNGIINGNLTGFATTSRNIDVVATSANLAHYLLFSPTQNGSGIAVSSGSSITVNPNTNVLSIGTGTFAANGVSVGSAPNTITTASGNLNIDSFGGQTNLNDNVVISGNLTVQGTTLTVDSTISTLVDPVIVIGSGVGGTHSTLDNNQDRGIEFRWSNSGTAVTGFFGFSDTDGKFRFIPQVTSLISSVYSGTAGTAVFTTVEANLSGNSTGTASTYTNFYGTFNGNLVGTSTTSINVHLAAGANSTAHSVIFSPNQTGSGVALSSDSLFTYNPNSDTLVVSNITGIATTAIYAHQAGYAITSGSASFANTATYAHQAGYAITSGSASIATTATYAHQAGYAITSGSASIATSTFNISLQNGLNNTSHSLIFSPTSSGSGIALSTNQTVTYNPFTSVLSVSGVAVTSSTNSVSSITGAAIVTGGVGIGSSVSVGGRLQLFNSSNYTAFVSSATGNTVYTLPATSPAIGSSVLQSTSAGVLSWVPLVASAAAGNTSQNIFVNAAGTADVFHQVLFTPVQQSAGSAVSSDVLLSFNANSDRLFASGISITSGAASTSPYTGALQVTGGLGVSGQATFARASLGFTGVSVTPVMSFIGATTGPIISLSVLNDNSLSFEGSSGQLFAIDNNLSTGEIFSVSDISGLPIISASAGQTVAINEFGGVTRIGDGTYNAVSTANAGLVVIGGFGVTGNAFIGGTTTITSVTNSTLPSNGALLISGGLGIGQSVSIGGRLQIFNGSNYAAFVSSATGNTVYTLPATSPAIGSSVLQSTAAGVMSWVPMVAGSSSSGNTSQNVVINAAGNANVFHPVLFTPLQASSGSAVSSDSTITFNPSSEILNVSGLAVTSITASTSIGSGALIVAGGVGIGGSLYVASATAISGVLINNGIITGNLTGTASFANTATYAHESGYAITSGTASFATTAANINLVNASTDSAHPILFSPLGSGSGVAVSSDLTVSYNPSTNILSTSGLAVTANTVSTNSSSGALIVSGGVGIGGSLYVAGDLTINGTTTTINSVTLTVDDKNIELGSVTSPSDATAEGGGITLKGSTDKALNWYAGTGWSSNQSWNLSSGNTYKINSADVLSNSSLGTGVTNSSLTALGTISTGVWAGTLITALYGGTGFNSYTKGDLLVGAGTSLIKHAVGSQNQILIADLFSGSGLSWATFANPTYGSFYSTSSQPVVGAGATTLATFNSTYETNRVAIIGGSGTSSRIQIQDSGPYSLTFSAQINLTDGSQPKVGDFWFRINGQDVPQSNTQMTISGKDFQTVITINFVYTFATNDYFEIAFSSDDSNFRIEALSGLTNPPRPNIPSIILSVLPVTHIVGESGAGISGILSLNGSTSSQQYFLTGTSGSDFNITTASGNHTFNIPIAGTGATGLLTSQAQTIGGAKTFTNDVFISSSTGSTWAANGALRIQGGLGVSGQLSFNQAALGFTGAVSPSIAFIGGTTGTPITMTVLSDNSLIFEGTSGKLFGINNNLSSGWIFNVGDISGLPLLRANADGTVAMAEFAGNVGIGLSNPAYKLHVNSLVGFTASTASTNTTTGALIVTGGVGIGQSVSVGGRLQLFNSANFTAFVSSATGNTVYTLPATSPATGSSVLQSTAAGVMSWVPMTGSGNTAQNIVVNTAGNANVFHPILFTPSSLSAGSAVSSDSTISFNPSTEILHVSGLAVTSTTSSTSSSTGALVVSGGMGVSGDLFVAANAGSKLSVMQSVGDEGGEIFLNKPATNSTITNGVTIDIFQNRLRFFEQGGSARGFYLDITSGGNSVGTNIMGGASSGTVNSGTANYAAFYPASSNAVSENANLQFTGTGISVGGNIAATSTTSGSLRVYGGVGIGGSTYIDGMLRVGTDTFSKNYSQGDISLDNGTTDTPAIRYYWTNNKNFGTDVFSAGSGSTKYRIVRDLNEAGGAELFSVDTTGAVQLYNGGNYSGFKFTGSGSTIYTLPSSAPATGTSYLTSNAAGVMSWIRPKRSYVLSFGAGFTPSANAADSIQLNIPYAPDNVALNYIVKRVEYRNETVSGGTGLSFYIERHTGGDALWSTAHRIHAGSGASFEVGALVNQISFTTINSSAGTNGLVASGDYVRLYFTTVGSAANVSISLTIEEQ